MGPLANLSIAMLQMHMAPELLSDVQMFAPVDAHRCDHVATRVALYDVHSCIAKRIRAMHVHVFATHVDGAIMKKEIDRDASPARRCAGALPGMCEATEVPPTFLRAGTVLCTFLSELLISETAIADNVMRYVSYAYKRFPGRRPAGPRHACVV